MVYCHGFKSFKDWGFIPYICERAAEAGFIAINLDFAYNGIKDSQTMVFDESLFSQNTITREIKDLYELLDALYFKRTDFKFPAWNNKIYLAGHSLGGAISLIVASKRNDISAVSTWGAVSKLDRNTQRQKEIWQKLGYTEVKIADTGQILKLNYTYLLDKEENFSRTAIIDACRSLNCPVLVIHGSNDMTVRLKEAYELYDNTKHINNSEIFVIERTGHTFGARHPMIVPNVALDAALDKMIKFFNENN
jgi:pimeloyl-ACP methyl ester carboxylesterase